MLEYTQKTRRIVSFFAHCSLRKCKYLCYSVVPVLVLQSRPPHAPAWLPRALLYPLLFPPHMDTWPCALVLVLAAREREKETLAPYAGCRYLQVRVCGRSIQFKLLSRARCSCHWAAPSPMHPLSINLPAPIINAMPRICLAYLQWLSHVQCLCN